LGFTTTNKAIRFVSLCQHLPGQAARRPTTLPRLRPRPPLRARPISSVSDQASFPAIRPRHARKPGAQETALVLPGPSLEALYGTMKFRKAAERATTACQSARSHCQPCCRFPLSPSSGSQPSGSAIADEIAWLRVNRLTARAAAVAGARVECCRSSLHGTSAPACRSTQPRQLPDSDQHAKRRTGLSYDGCLSYVAVITGIPTRCHVEVRICTRSVRWICNGSLCTQYEHYV
jgi:hypothetical protein